LSSASLNDKENFDKLYISKNNSDHKKDFDSKGENFFNSLSNSNKKHEMKILEHQNDTSINNDDTSINDTICELIVSNVDVLKNDAN